MKTYSQSDLEKDIASIYLTPMPSAGEQEENDKAVQAEYNCLASDSRKRLDAERIDIDPLYIDRPYREVPDGSKARLH